MKKKIMAGVLAVVGVCVLSGGIYATWLMTPPAMPNTAEEAAALLTSARFQRLSTERKMAYMARVRELMGEMDGDERRAFFEANRGNEQLREAGRELRREMQVQQARDYAAAAPEDRVALLDEMIDQRMAMFRGMGGGPPGGWRGGPQVNEQGEPLSDEERAAQREQRMAERMQERQLEEATGNPQDDALISEMRTAMRQRMTERGMDFGRGGRGGGGGGRGR